MFPENFNEFLLFSILLTEILTLNRSNQRETTIPNNFVLLIHYNLLWLTNNHLWCDCNSIRKCYWKIYIYYDDIYVCVLYLKFIDMCKYILLIENTEKVTGRKNIP